jgi:8-oxo-dGTP diphosphatase
MAKILQLRADAIDNALQGVTRQYLVGDLQKPQELSHIPNHLIEIGITRYGPQGGCEPPHTHTQAFESQYMLSGKTAYLDTVTGEEHVFGAGDFYLIEPGVSYAQKSVPDTAILFIKVPAGNDKIPVSMTDDIQAWFEKPIPT